MDRLKALEKEHQTAMNAHMKKLRGVSMFMSAVVCISGPLAIALSGSAVVGVIAAIASLGVMYGVMALMRRRAEAEIAMNAARREEILDEMK